MTHSYDPDADRNATSTSVVAGTVDEPAALAFDDDPFAADAFDDDLAAKLAAQSASPRATRTTLILGGLALVVGGFVGGVLVQRNFGATTSTGGPGGSLPAAIASGFPGGFGQAAGQGGQGTGGQGTGGQATGAGAGNATTGTVRLVDGTTIYIVTADGETVTVKTNDSTTVASAQAAALKDLKVGATVTVQGTANADGVVTATQVTTTK